MERAGYTDKRIKKHGNGFSYKRSGELLKVELKKVMQELGMWNQTYETQHKRAWRGHIRDACGIEYNSQMGWEKFDLHDLTQIWRELQD